MKLAVLQPLTDPQVIDVDGDSAAIWRAAQGIVGGYIEVVYVTEPEPDPEPFARGWHLAAYVNEEGILIGQPLNRMISDEIGLFGPIVIVRERIDGEGETHYADLTEEDLRLVSQWAIVIPLPLEARSKS